VFPPLRSSLGLVNNGLKSSIPESISALSALECVPVLLATRGGCNSSHCGLCRTINLSENKLNGTIPEAISGLSNVV
jgi:hypothetical protein